MQKDSEVNSSSDNKILRHISSLLLRYPILETIKQSITDAYEILEESYEQGGKLLIAGNGGSAADAEHIAGELMKRFMTKRPVKQEFAERLISIDSERGEKLSKNLECSLMAIPLVAHEALTTAYINDVDGLGVFAQQLFGYGREGDVFLGISTSGNSENILNAAVVARALRIKVLALTGMGGGKLKAYADVSVEVPQTETYLIQELHLPIYHCWCLMLEERFFGGVSN
jgi:D-sedoheptulose 7-phosphate isomerase